MRHHFARLCGVLVLLAVPGIAAAQPSWRDFPGVSNSSFVEPNGDRAIQLSIEVPAEPSAVFSAFTTSEGFRSWRFQSLESTSAPAA